MTSKALKRGPESSRLLRGRGILKHFDLHADALAWVLDLVDDRDDRICGDVGGDHVGGDDDGDWHGYFPSFSLVIPHSRTLRAAHSTPRVVKRICGPAQSVRAAWTSLISKRPASMCSCAGVSLPANR